MKYLPLILFAGMLSIGHAATISINFAVNNQDSTATDNYISTELGISVTEWDYQGTKWSGNGTTFTADGATIGIYHDASSLGTNPDAGANSPLRGYLNDNLQAKNYIHLTGLTDWLTNVSATEYKMTVLRSANGGTGFDPIELKVGNVTGESGWLGQSDPTGATVQDLGTFGAVDLGAAGTQTYETPTIVLDDNGVALHFLITGGPGVDPRGTISGILIESVSVAVPEPSTVLLSIVGLGALIMRRRR